MMHNIFSNKHLWLPGSLLCICLSACTANPPTQIEPITSPPTQPVPTEVTSSATPTLIAESDWAGQLTEIAAFEEVANAIWSPTRNELVANDCRTDQEFGNLLYAEAPEFNIVGISPEGSRCNSDNLSRTVIIWSLDGEEIFWWGLGAGPDLLPNTLLKTDRNFGQPVDLGRQDRAVSFHGWLDQDLLLLSNFTGGDAVTGSVVNVKLSETAAIIPGFQEFYRTSSPAFVGQGPGRFKTEEPIQDSLVRIDNDLSFTSDIIPIHESFTDPYGVRFIDWVPEQSQLLTLVWRDAYLLTDENLVTELQLWNFASDEVVPLIPNGYYGRYSPDGRYLAFYAFNKFTSNTDGSFGILDEDHSSYLYILDTNTNEFLIELDGPLPPFIGDLDVHSPGEEEDALIWSPNSDALIFINEDDRYSILEITSGAIQPVTSDPEIRVWMPRWSYDGSYLSVTVFAEDQPGKLTIFLVN